MACKYGIICRKSQPKCAQSLTKADDLYFCQSHSALHMTSTGVGGPDEDIFRTSALIFIKFEISEVMLLFLPPQKNKPLTPMICGVRINLYFNSRALINSPLMENCVFHVRYASKQKRDEKQAEDHLLLQNSRKLLLDFWFQHPVCRVSFLGDEPED